jgi:hypothetical protein
MLERLRKSSEWEPISGRFNKGNWFKGHNSCLCGSGVKIRSCHHAALEGMWKFGKNLMHHDLNSKN